MEHLGKLPIVGQVIGQVIPILGLVTVAKQMVPQESHYVVHAIRALFNPFCFFSINEFEGSLPNDFYTDIQLHLESCKAYNKAKSVTLFRKPNTVSVTMRLADSSDVVVDVYKGMTVWWTHIETKETDAYSRARHYYSGYGGGGSSSRKFQLKVRKRDKARLLPEYLDFITRNSKTYSGKTREIKIFTNADEMRRHYSFDGSRRMWEEVPYKHPSTFDTLAIDPRLKATIIADLTSFTTDQAFYQRSGRAWKRGYLLYGPPGTGKSSMIAAMANFLKYDIYDLELSQVRTNGELRQLLIQTSNRSIVVLEDIDCSVNFTHSRGGRSRTVAMPALGSPNPEDDPSKVTLAGLLNFVDGLWSCCGDERIFVFTTNYVEKLDKALLRPGRMDMQIELSYCTFPAFKVLAHNYLATQEHPLFAALESAFQEGKTITPAQIAELLIKDKSNVDLALQNVLSALENNVPTDPITDNNTSTVKEPASKFDTQNLIATLQGVIEALSKTSSDVTQATSELSPSSSDKASEALKHFKESSPGSSSNMRDLMESVRSAWVKNKGDIDSAIESIIQALPNSEIVEHAAEENGHLRKGNGSASSKANGVCVESENGGTK